MNVLIVLSFSLLILPLVSCANILALIPTPSHSHQVAFAPLWKELSLKGHQVTVLTTDPQNDPNLTNLTEIDLKWTYKFWNISIVLEHSVNMWNIYDVFKHVVEDVIEGQLSYEPVQNLMREKTFDVVLVEFMYPEFLAFAELYNCPKILIASLDASSVYHHLMGNPSHPILNPDFLTSFYDNLSFKDRVISTVYDFYMSQFVYKKLFHQRQVFLNKYFNTKSTVDELLSDVDMMFVNVNPVIQRVRALGPSTITFGGIRKTSLKPLPKDLQDFLDSANEGFIYFSLGSNVKSKDLRTETLEAIKDTLRELPYKVLWKFEADYLPGKPDNVKLVKWAPQQSVLAHRNIKLFVTQGGLQSMEESIYSEVPLVVIPFFGDQEHNAKLMKSKGIATVVEVRPHLDKIKLKSAILEVINNPNYRNAVRRLKHLALDTPMTGLEKAVWWTEYVIRNKGAKHLRNPAADIPFYQYYLLDVVAFLFFITVLVIFVSVLILKTLYKFIYTNFLIKSATKVKSN